MSLTTTMDALAAALNAQGRYTYAYPARKINTPAVVVGYPTIEFDTTFRDGSETNVYPIWWVLSLITADVDRTAISAAIAEGKSDIDAIASPECRTMTAEVVTMTVGDLDYIAVRFDVEVIE